jgi:NTE family protein
MSRLGPVAAEHVLASAALPFLFPARRIGRSYYCDGGLRFNTPISPAIRCGAQRLVVIPLLHLPTSIDRDPAAEARQAAYPSPVFLVGKLLNALLVDPIDYDLHVLERVNRLIEMLEQTLDESLLAQVRGVLEDSRGLSYRRIETLVFRPSQDIGLLASERARELRGQRFASHVLTRIAQLGTKVEADLLSFFLFDGEFADRLIELGRRDAWARADEIHDFFEPGGCAREVVAAE